MLATTRAFSKAALRRRREQAKLSRHELSQATGIATDTIVKLEFGYRKTPRADTLALLADALGCKIDDLFEVAA